MFYNLLLFEEEEEDDDEDDEELRLPWRWSDSAAAMKNTSRATLQPEEGNIFWERMFHSAVETSVAVSPLGTIIQCTGIIN